MMIPRQKTGNAGFDLEARYDVRPASAKGIFPFLRLFDCGKVCHFQIKKVTSSSMPNCDAKTTI